jgi:hypothetical protein
VEQGDWCLSLLREPRCALLPHPVLINDGGHVLFGSLDIMMEAWTH